MHISNPTDEAIIKACREILWPSGKWPDDQRPTGWTYKHLEALASVLEPNLQGGGTEPETTAASAEDETIFEQCKALRDMARDVLNADSAGPDQMREAMQELYFAVKEAESKIPSLVVK